MLIYLLPAEPHPRLYHSVNFTDPYMRVPLPTGWAAQLHCLHTDELDLPNAMHALDKAAWLTAVIEELVFDLVSQTVSCAFVNGPTVRWSMAGYRACRDALERVFADVVEWRAELDRERAAAASPKVQPIALPRLVSVKPAKHKKQRSLLSSLISSFNKLGSGPPSQDIPTTPTPPAVVLSPAIVIAVTLADLMQAHALIPPDVEEGPDAGSARPFALYCPSGTRTLAAGGRLSQVRPRGSEDAAPPGGYAPWAARCMLHHAEDHMAWLVQEAGGVVPDLIRTLPPRRLTASGLSGSTLVSVAEARLYNEEDEEERSLTDSASTETDGSSVHTPVDSPSASPFAPAARTDRPAQHVPRSPSPAEFSAEDLATYTALSAQCMRLRQLLTRMDAAHANAEQDERHFQAVLEVKSRRRAWSNRAYLGGAAMAGVGLAQPFRSSPLARCDPVTPEFLCAHLLEVTTGEHNLSTLFPVSEEDEEEEEDEDEEEFSLTRLSPDAALCDLESGLLPPLSRPQMRARTHSMHPLHALDVDLALCPEPPTILVPPAPPPMHVPLPVSPAQILPSSALLYQPLKPALEAQTKLELFDHLEHAAEGEDGVAPEFTLSMDLLPPYTRTGREREGWIGSTDAVR